MRDQNWWTLVLAFGAGLLPGVVFGLYVLAVVRARLAAMTARRDAWQQAQDELKSRCAALAAENSKLAQVENDLAAMQQKNARLDAALVRMEKDLAEARVEKGELEAALARERERIRRTVKGLGTIREIWLNHRRPK